MPRNIDAFIAVAILTCAGCGQPAEPSKAAAPVVAARPEPAFKVNTDKKSADFDPDEEFPEASEFVKLHTSATKVIAYAGLSKPGFSPDGKWVTFSRLTELRNISCVQLAEIELTGYMMQRPPDGQPSEATRLFRTKPQTFKGFSNYRIPHFGAIEPYGDVRGAIKAKWKFPAELWRTDTYPTVEVTRMVAVTKKDDLHDIGNMIEFIDNNHMADVERAILKDPGLMKVRDSEGTTPMLIAMADGTPRLARFMMAHGGNIHDTNKRGEDAMYYAAIGNNPKMLDFVLSQGFTVDPTASKPLLKAASLDEDRSVQWLIAHHADLNRAGPDGYTPLARTIYYANSKSYQLLMAAKPDLHCHTKEGKGLIQLSLGSPAVLKSLVIAGVPIEDPIESTGETALREAAKLQSFQSARWLLANGANVKAKDKKGQDVFDYARAGTTLHTDEFFRRAMGDALH
jgi:ankyrin repeat protein